MDSEHLKALLEICGTDQKDGWSVLKDDRTLTLHASHEGVGLNVAKIAKLKVEGNLLVVENVHGDVSVLSAASVFAGAVDPGSKKNRKAGFR